MSDGKQCTLFRPGSGLYLQQKTRVMNSMCECHRVSCDCLPVVRCLHVGEVVEGATVLVVTGLIGKLIAIAVLRQVEEDIVQRAILARAD